MIIRRSPAAIFMAISRIILLITAALFSVLPFFWAVLLSLKLPVDALSMPPTLLFNPQTSAYHMLFADPQFRIGLTNSLVVTSIVVVASTIIGALAGYALARYRQPASFMLLTASLILYALPRTAFLLPYHQFGQRTGLYDSRLLLIFAMTGFVQPFTIWIFEGFFREMPEDLEKAAMIDGCTRLQALFRVVIPISGPALATGAIFSMLFAYNDFLLPVILTSTNASTMPVLIANYAGTSDMNRWPIFAAASVVVALPMILIMLAGQRLVVRGLVVGAVK